MSVRDARDAYLAENGFTVAAYDDKWTMASLLGFSFGIANTPRHRWALQLHDLHHVATGYGTDLAGEAEISAWEARRGLGTLGLYVGAIIGGLAMLGVPLAPRRALHAWRSAPGDASLFHAAAAYASLLAKTVGELRELLRVPARGVNPRSRALHAKAPR